MQLILATVSLSLLSLTVAAGTCTSSGSLSWPPAKDCTSVNKYPTAVQTCRACCLNDGNCFQTCAKTAGLRKRESISERFVGSIVEKRNPQSRNTIDLSCGTNEGCYKFTDGSLLCLNLGTGLYHDDVGGTGSYFSGEYTGPDGRVQTGTSTVAAATGSKTSVGSSRGSSSTRSVGAGGVTSAVGATVSSAVASVTSQAGAGFALKLGANVGLVGVAAGLMI